MSKEQWHDDTTSIPSISPIPLNANNKENWTKKDIVKKKENLPLQEKWSEAPAQTDEEKTIIEINQLLTNPEIADKIATIIENFKKNKIETSKPKEP
jgi:hypothetical protein